MTCPPISSQYALPVKENQMFFVFSLEPTFEFQTKLFLCNDWVKFRKNHYEITCSSAFASIRVCWTGPAKFYPLMRAEFLLVKANNFCIQGRRWSFEVVLWDVGSKRALEQIHSTGFIGQILINTKNSRLCTTL